MFNQKNAPFYFIKQTYLLYFGGNYTRTTIQLLVSIILQVCLAPLQLCEGARVSLAQWRHLWSYEFRGEHLPEGGCLEPLTRAACDLFPQLRNSKSHVKVSKHTCWKARWERSLDLPRLDRVPNWFELHLPNQIPSEDITKKTVRTLLSL